MNIRKQRKLRLKHLPRYNQGGNGLYAGYCCKSCYFSYGRFFEEKHLYKHESAKNNYDGILKKYWEDYNANI